MLNTITLKPMTRALCHRLFQNFTADPAIFREDQPFREYSYSQKGCDAYYDRQQTLNRIHLAVMLEDQIIGEIILKSIDRVQASCCMSIHMMNDTVKNKGYGTAAEILLLEYAFTKENFQIVYADALSKNTRSRHVLKKAGFREIKDDGSYAYYYCVKP